MKDECVVFDSVSGWGAGLIVADITSFVTKTTGEGKGVCLARGYTRLGKGVCWTEANDGQEGMTMG